MAELGDVEISLGKPNAQDRADFLALWTQFLIEQVANGGDTEATDSNLLEFLGIYDSYTNGSLFGCCLIARDTAGAPVGVILGGEKPEAFTIRSRRDGRIFWLFGVYVVPSYRRSGLAWAMQDRCQVESLNLGFRWVRSLVLAGYPIGEANAFGWGAKPVATVIEHDLREPAGRRLAKGERK